MQSKEHNHGFIPPKWCNECCFPLVTVLDADVVVSCLNIQLGKYLGILDPVDKFINKGQQVYILDCCFIQGFVVLNQPQQSVLGYEKEG